MPDAQKPAKRDLMPWEKVRAAQNSTQENLRSTLGALSSAPAARPPFTPVPELRFDGFDRSIDRLKTEAAGGGGGGIIPPLYLQESATDPTTKVNVKYGTVGGIVPTTVATDITVSGTNGTWYIFIDATIDAAGDVTAATISSNTTGVTTDSDTHAYYLIGTVTVASSVITAINPTLMFSQEFAACGRDSADPTTTPGIYYFFVA
jgi:hypothetical protein